MSRPAHAEAASQRSYIITLCFHSTLTISCTPMHKVLDPGVTPLSKGAALVWLAKLAHRMCTPEPEGVGLQPSSITADILRAKGFAVGMRLAADGRRVYRFACPQLAIPWTRTMPAFMYALRQVPSATWQVSGFSFSLMVCTCSCIGERGIYYITFPGGW